MDCKITKLVGDHKYHLYSLVHFKLNGTDYVLNMDGGADYTLVTYLYKGRMKCHLERVGSCLGIPYNLIVFKRKKGCLKYIDTEHFINKLLELGLITKEELENKI